MSPSPSTSRAPVWRRRLLASLLGVVLVPLLFEVGLRIAALFVSRDRAGTGSAYVVCQGDSNTFGLHVEPEEAYPGALQALFDEHGLSDKRVVNRGVPGKPSWAVANELEHDLELYRPRIVIVMVGVNDRNQLRPDDWMSKVLQSSRFARMVRRTLTNASETVHAAERSTGRSKEGSDEPPTFEMNFGTADERTIARWTREGYERIVARVREAGATPVLMTYFDSVSSMEGPSKTARNVARDTGALLVDLRELFAPALRELGTDALEFPDAHLRPVGYRIVARAIFDELAKAKLIDAEPLGDPLAPLAELDTQSPKVHAWTEDGKPRGVTVEYRPNFRAQLLVSDGPGMAPVRYSGFVRSAAPLRATRRATVRPCKLLGDSMNLAPELTVRLDEHGAGRIALPAVFDAEPTLWACVAFVDERNEIVRISNPLELR
ncbi:MAG: SGNH/GDSL hydrolase family protein [Planctomycetes bacterium]|nr:SGNH/GDSL hydrolase family protein [Planctomycetota bacterium]